MRNYTDAILFRICEKLQLTPTLYEQAKERYETIAGILQDDAAFANIDLNIYPHGSFRQKTTVKPLKAQEYDLDFVAELPIYSAMTPNELYNHIVRILRHDGIHNNMVELKKRCVRIKYANDFHMDIMPGKLINSGTHEIIVPDRELKSWYHTSNPIGFAEWFENQARTQIIHEINTRRRIQCSVETVTEQEIVAQLEPLRRAVQLVKRYRDVYCDRTGKEPVRSIVICTLLGQISSFSGDALQIINAFCAYVNGLIAKSTGKPFDVKNPVVDEILTEKWKGGKNYKDFVDMMKALTFDVQTLQSHSINTSINDLVKKMFGETIAKAAIEDYASQITAVRTAGNLSVTKGGTLRIDPNGVMVKKNTFYGSGG